MGEIFNHAYVLLPEDKLCTELVHVLPSEVGFDQARPGDDLVVIELCND